MTISKKDLDWAKHTRNELFLFGDADLSEQDFESLVKLLRIADDLYYNVDGHSPLTDEEYDAIRRYCEVTNSDHTYFLGIGAEVRGGKIKLPYTMGSLDQIYQGEVASWIADKKLREADLLITEKLDGTSAQIVFGPEGSLQIAYSRGNGVEGADITRHIRRFKSIPKNVSEALVVRGEVIVTKSNFPIIQSKATRSGGSQYKNARNMVAGLMNSSENNPVVYEYLDFVAYDIVNKAMDKNEMLETLHTLGFKVPKSHHPVKGGGVSDQFLTDILNTLRNRSEYEIDGIVVDVNSVEFRRKLVPSRETLNPAYAIKYKVADASNLAIAEVIGVEWNVSKHGYLKPRVNIKPINLVGVTVQYATGFNAKFISENGIGPGAKIQVTRSGDVIPFIQAVVHPTKAQMPSVDWKWNETEVDAVLTSKKDNMEIAILQTLDFFATIKAPHLKEGNIRELFTAGKFPDSTVAIRMIIKANKPTMEEALGANGSKIHDGIHEKLSNIPLYVFAGAMPYFGRGVGTRKMKKLINGLAGLNVPEDFQNLTLANIVSVEGFDEKTAHKILNGVSEFVSLYKSVAPYITFTTVEVAEGGSMKDQKVVFTGFRDAELEAQVEAAGGQMQSGVSGKTTILVCTDPNSNSGKAKKARDLGVKVVGVDEFRSMLE